MDVGSWLYAGCVQNCLGFAEFPPETVKHFVAMSWRNNKAQALELAWSSPEVAALESELESMPQLRDVYRRHVKREAVATE